MMWSTSDSFLEYFEYRCCCQQLYMMLTLPSLCCGNHIVSTVHVEWFVGLWEKKKTNVYVCNHSFLLIGIRSRERHGIWNQRQASCLFNSVLKMPTIIKAPHNKPFVRKIQHWRVDFPDKCLVMRNVFIYHDVITVKGFVCIGVTTLLSCPETSFL